MGILSQTKDDSLQAPLKVAFLGPVGTHTHGALQEHFKAERYDAIACLSITEVFHFLVTKQADCGFVPLENMSQGPVTETLDLLYEQRGKVLITESAVREIKHALGVFGDANDLARIEKIYSHPQALQQCSRYLRATFPHAEFVPFASTAQAATLLAKEKLKNVAVVCSKRALDEHALTLIKENISDVPGNSTRFIVLRRDAAYQPGKSEQPKAPRGVLKNYVTSLVIDPGNKDRKGMLFELLEILSKKHNVNLLAIHSRPDARGGFLFYLDLQGHPSENSVFEALEDLHKYCKDILEAPGISVFGYYSRVAFARPRFDRIGIIGGAGIMGAWFSKFFREAGFEVSIVDKDTSDTLASIVPNVQVILLSLPMAVVPEIAKELSPLLKPGQLVVENCSIKNSSLPFLQEHLPADVELLGVHTMFAGDIETLRGQNMVVTETKRSKELARAFCDVFYKYGVNITEATAETHDKASAHLQSLVHFMLVCFSEVLKNSFTSRKELDGFKTPNASNILNTAERVLKQDEKLSADFQTLNAESQHVRRRFLESVCRISSAFDHDNVEAYKQSIKKSRAFFTED